MRYLFGMLLTKERLKKLSKFKNEKRKWSHSRATWVTTKNFSILISRAWRIEEQEVTWFKCFESKTILTNYNSNYAQISGPAEAVVKRRRASVRMGKEFVKNCMVRETYFTNRMANSWNKLEEEIIQAKTVNGFKARYDKHFNR